MVQSLVRGVEILERVAASDSGCTLAELSAGLGLKPPTVFNLARTLMSRGYLEKVSRPVRYRLGPAVAHLSALQRERRWAQESESAVRRLFTRLGCATVVAAEADVWGVRMRLRMDPSRPGVVERVPDRGLSPYGSATSLCFQAFWPSADVREFQRRFPLATYGSGSWTAPALARFLNRVRAQGYVVLAEPGPFRVAAPVYGSGNQLVGIVGASLNREPRPGLAATVREQTEGAVVGAARELSARLGCMSPGETSSPPFQGSSRQSITVQQRAEETCT